MRFIKNGLALAIGLLIALVILEIFLRLYTPFNVRVKGNKIMLPINRVYTIKDVGIEGLDETIVHTKNELGFRGPKLPENFEDHLTIIATGGSTTEGFYASDGKDWPNVLRQYLEPTFPNLWLNNAGFDGFSTFGNQMLLEDTLVELKPDVILFFLGINDVGAKSPSEAELIPTKKIPWSSFRNVVLAFSRKSEVVSLAINLYRSYRAQNLGVGHERIILEEVPEHEGIIDVEDTLDMHRKNYLKGYRQRLQTIIETSRAAGIEPVFLTHPALYGNAVDPKTGVDLGKIKINNLNGDISWKVVELYNETMRNLAAEEDVFLIDLAKNLEKNSLYFYDFYHSTNQGMQEIGRLVYEALCPFLQERYPDQVSGSCLHLPPFTDIKGP